MVDFQYAKGRIEESVAFITKEMEEFEKDGLSGLSTGTHGAIGYQKIDADG